MLDIKVNDKVLLESHILSSKALKRVAKFGPKIVDLHEVLAVRNNNFILSINEERVTVSMAQVIVYKDREYSPSSSENSANTPPP